MRHSTLLPFLGLLSSLWLLLAGCGGNSGSSSGGGDSAPRVRHLTIQFSRPAGVVSAVRHQENVSAQGRQVQPGDPGFIQRLVVQLQTPQGQDLLPSQEFTLGPAEQETVALDVMLPALVPAELRILVAAFNNFNNQQSKIFLGQALMQRGQESATITLARNPDPTTLIPVRATSDTLTQKIFPFTDGAIFDLGLRGVPVILSIGDFQGNTGSYTLTSGAGEAGGLVTIGSCDFVVIVSTFPPGRGPQVDGPITFDPCQVDAVDGRLTATNVRLNISATSEAPIVSSLTSALILPLAPLILVLDENTEGTVPITAALTGTRPGNISFALTELPAQGTAVVDRTTGLVTYRPAANVTGSTSLVVTVTATFTDGATPPFLVGTVPVAITVRSINHPPGLTNPGNQTTLEDATVSLPLSASDSDDDTLTFSAVGLPPGLSFNATTGLISGTVAPGAAVGSPYSVTVTVSDGLASASASFLWTVPIAPLVPLADILVDNSTSTMITVLDLVSVLREEDRAINLDTLTFTVQNNTNPSLVATLLRGATLTLTYQPRQRGVAVITIRVTDQSGFFVDTAFTITVNRTFPFVLGLSQLGDPFQPLSDSAN